MKRLGAFTLIELVISVALLIVAISIALFAVVGANGMIQKADARSSISESTRSVNDEIRRATANSPVGGITLLSDQGTTVAIQVKAFSYLQSGNTCTIIGRATASTDQGGEEKYTIAKGGAVVAILVYNVDSGGLCPQLSTSPIYQNRLTNPQTTVKDLQLSLQTTPCTTVTTTCVVKQILRYSLTLETVRKGSGGTSEARQPTLTTQEGLAIGLVNEEIMIFKIDTISLPDANAKGLYTASVVASGGVPNYTWSKTSGSWPPGNFNIDPVTGVISGTPNSQQAAGHTYPITIQVTDSDNPINTATKDLSIKVLDNEIAITTTSPLSDATEDSNYNVQLSATFGTNQGACGAICDWSMDSGGLPSGVTLTESGKISGKPDLGTAGVYSPVIRVTDADNLTNSTTKLFSLTVLPKGGQSITITTTALPNGSVGQLYNNNPNGYQLTATGAASYVWSISSGSLPPGLQLNALTGYIYGTPACPAGLSAPFTIKATDSGNPLIFGTKQFTITIIDQFFSCGIQEG